MKYFQIRTALLTFALGLASIPFANFLQAKWIESSVDLPKVNSTDLIIISPKYDREIVKGGGSGGCGRMKYTPKSSRKLKKRSISA